MFKSTVREKHNENSSQNQCLMLIILKITEMRLIVELPPGKHSIDELKYTRMLFAIVVFNVELKTGRLVTNNKTKNYKVVLNSNTLS